MIQQALNVSSEKELFDLVLLGFQVSSLLILGALLLVGSPYGSQTAYSGIFAINGKVAWMAMELVSPLVFAYSYFARRPQTLATHVFFFLWMAHYANRAILYPLRQQSRKPMHAGIMLCAYLFNAVNGYLNARYLAAFSDPLLYSAPYFARHPMRSLLGIGLFVCGMAGNIHHDSILSGLRTHPAGKETGSAGEGRYLVPYGGLFKFVSCPHFLCELVEWTGFAVLTQSPAAWTFVANIVCNLLPRALCIHGWYRKEFADYPASRRALIPFLI
ncbi:3-oxo-5-alpha-steroid 4-dehydrogenase [Martensiomyces pterosporus]|nr:3-oxo-5-alpha-steroid 4-dehydrogenase [Martensiomyces pterosporus]